MQQQEKKKVTEEGEMRKRLRVENERNREKQAENM